MQTIYNSLLPLLQPNINVFSIYENKFPTFTISVKDFATNPYNSTRDFDGYYFVPKFDPSFNNTDLARIKFLISFDSYPATKMTNWVLKFGDGTAIQDKPPVNLELYTEINLNYERKNLLNEIINNDKQEIQS